MKRNNRVVKKERKKMGNYKYLAKNIGVLALSNFATKLLSFFLVPLYTSILTTEEYGTYDLFATTVYLLVPILTLNIQDATIRFSLDKNYEKKDIISISLDIFGKGLVILLVFSAVNHVANLLPIFNDYLLVFVLMYIFQALVGIMTAFARGCEKSQRYPLQVYLVRLFLLDLTSCSWLFLNWA